MDTRCILSLFLISKGVSEQVNSCLSSREGTCVSGLARNRELCELGTWVWALVQPLVHGSGFKGALAVTGTDISKYKPGRSSLVEKTLSRKNSKLFTLNNTKICDHSAAVIAEGNPALDAELRAHVRLLVVPWCFPWKTARSHMATEQDVVRSEDLRAQLSWLLDST